MICALSEIGLEEDTEENYKKGIYVFDDDARVGVDALEYMGACDTLYDLDIHKHKNNDCFYHIGFAYEIGAILGKKVKLPGSVAPGRATITFIPSFTFGAPHTI